MAKQIEPYEEDDFLLEDQQNSNEEQIIEEEEEDIEEEALLKLRPRPPRASLTHNAIKSEILKMKKQDSGDDNEENLSRSARKRKKRREKVLEERRASGGRGVNFEDDLAHFKSIPISRRRSSLLPLNQAISLPNYNNGDGFCSTLKCCLWVLMVVGALIGLLYVWPTVADLEVTDQSNTFLSEQNELTPEQLISNEIDEGEQIINSINKLNEELGGTDNQEENNQNYEESIGTFDYISSFFGSENTAAATEATEQDNIQSDEQQIDEQNNDAENNLNEDLNEQIIVETTVPDDQVDEGFEEQPNDEQSVNEQETLSYTVPERYQSAVHQEGEHLEAEENNSCRIGDQIYDNLNDEQCNLLQERQRQLEEQLRQQEQMIRQEQSNNNEEQEQFYFF